MKVLVIQHKSGNRFRTVQYFEALETQGFLFDNPYCCLKTSWSQWLSLAKEAEVVWIARKLLSLPKLIQLQHINPHIVFDFDDALWLRSSNRLSKTSLSKILKFQHSLEVAREVMAGNSFLAQESCRYIPPSRVHVIPTVVNRDWYSLRKGSSHSEFVVGWIGSRATLPYLERLKAVFEKFHDLKIPWRLKIISDTFPQWPHLPVEKKAWALVDEAQDLSEIDVGLNPLVDDDWSRGKCALKAIQYMAVGSAVLASPVGVNCELVEPGIHGYLPESTDQWVEALTYLAQNPQEAQRLGCAGHQKIWRDYAMESFVDHVAAILKRAAL